MSTTTATYPHIELNANGVPIVSGTTTKVIEIVRSYLGENYTAEEMCEAYPYLVPVQVHAAMAYYYDHREELDADMERGDREADEIRVRTYDDRFRNKLQELGLLP